jgi:hypothetical protein
MVSTVRGDLVVTADLQRIGEDQPDCLHFDHELSGSGKVLLQVGQGEHVGRLAGSLQQPSSHRAAPSSLLGRHAIYLDKDTVLWPSVDGHDPPEVEAFRAELQSRLVAAVLLADRS